jgi:hypothetical protein
VHQLQHPRRVPHTKVDRGGLHSVLRLQTSP